jgi:hypothetical protein
MLANFSSISVSKIAVSAMRGLISIKTKIVILGRK